MSVSSTRIIQQVLMVNNKSQKTNALAEGLTERISSMLDKTASKILHKQKLGDW